MEPLHQPSTADLSATSYGQLHTAKGSIFLSFEENYEANQNSNEDDGCE